MLYYSNFSLLISVYPSKQWKSQCHASIWISSKSNYSNCVQKCVQKHQYLLSVDTNRCITATGTAIQNYLFLTCDSHLMAFRIIVKGLESLQCNFLVGMKCWPLWVSTECSQNSLLIAHWRFSPGRCGHSHVCSAIFQLTICEVLDCCQLPRDTWWEQSYLLQRFCVCLPVWWVPVTFLIDLNNHSYTCPQSIMD